MAGREPVARHLVIHGRVQGVRYRDSLREQAGRLEITGWVRNRREGTVEAVIQGTPEAVEALMAWARRGPPLAVVERVDVLTQSPQPFDSFERLATL